jgi:hypothetical protein
MNRIYAVIVVIAILCGALFGAERYGEHVVQMKWDQDTAVRLALLNKVKQENKEALDANRKQYEKDKQAAASKAGRDAVARYMAERGLLSTCNRLSSGPGDVSAQSSGRTDESAKEPGTGAALESFTTDCALDALQVMRWQELCKANRCEVE